MKTCDGFRGRFLSIATSSFEIGKALGLLPFSGVTETVLCSKFMSVHFSCHASPLRIPVSLSSFRKAQVFLLHPEINELTSVS